MLALRLDYRTLWVQIVLALAYSILALRFDTLTTGPILDGLIGGLLGLYICSHPARNAIDLLFANRFAVAQILSSWAGRGWVALNGLTLLAGWLVLYLGIVRLIDA
jgi:hypothetical protein